MGAAIRAFDWSTTPVGEIETWPQSLITAVRIMLGSRYPMFVWWGRSLTKFYNDAYIPVLGKRHPQALGQSAAKVWEEIWDTLGPQTEMVLNQGQSTWNEQRLLVMERNGYAEETYFTFSYSPAASDDGGIGGVFCACTEDTRQVLSDRRLRTLRELAAATADAKTVENACKTLARSLEKNPYDVPFALLYLLDNAQEHADLVGATGISVGTSASPVQITLKQSNAWLLQTTLTSGKPQLINQFPAAWGTLPSGVWAEPTTQAIVLPLAASGQAQLVGFLIVGISPRREFDDDYRGFFDLMVGQMTTAIANAQAYEQERKRAEALAEIDRAKTAFFSNVSHEFRTPLTLMLSPLEELSNSLNERLQPDEREQLQLMQRNGLRLQKLVNTLLDFSRIEAGRVEVFYEPIDLATYTAELASTFRSLIERAKMALAIDCPPILEPVYVDRDMWEKIVLNLISNAFKFTFTGIITVRLQSMGDTVELSVKDTGVGIPAAELPRLFERFHRVSGTRSRTYEGSGIGLALVQELVKLHQGAIEVASVEGTGTCFTVSIPTGTAHLPQNRIGTTRTLTSTALGANSYLEEALRWLPESQQNVNALRGGELCSPPFRNNSFSSARVLLADDNADMRDYVRRLLSQQYEVEAVSDGFAALSAVRQQVPDLILTDVMMPNLDGFGLLQAIRSDPQTREVPIILLSARAGEESRIEGLAAGADDYLIKPFSARELLARVEASLKLAQLRREASQTLERSEERYRAFVQQSSEGIWRFEVEFPIPIDCPEDEQIQHFCQHAYLAECNQVVAQMYGASSPQDLLGTKLTDFFVPSDPLNLGYLRAFIRAGYRLIDAESYEVDRQGNSKIFLNNLIGIVEDGKLVRAWGTQRDITDRKQAQEALRERENLLSGIVGSITDALMVIDKDWHYTFASEEFLRRTGMSLSNIIGNNIWEQFPDAVGNEAYRQLHRAMAERVSVEYEVFYESLQSWFSDKAYPTADGGLAVYSRDITDRKQAELEREALLARERQYLDQLQGLTTAALAINSALSMEEVLQVITDQAASIISTHQSVTSMTNDQNWSQAITAVHLSDKYAAWRDYDESTDGSGIYACVCQLNRPMRMTQAELEAHPRWKGFGKEADRHPPLRGWLAAPLVGRNGQNIGLIQLSDKYEGKFTETDESILVQLAQMASVAIENTRLYEAEQQARSTAETAREEADRANRIKDEFLAVLSHELRSPLNPILGWTRLLQNGKLDETRQREALATIERNAKLQTQLIEDLLDISRIIQGKLSLTVAPVSLTFVITAAVETVRLAAEAKNIQILLDLNTAIAPVSGDAARLQQVVWNLLANAVKFTPNGGQVTVELRQTNQLAQIRVMDTGKGINPQFLPHVFEYFRQEDGSTTRKFGGLGLGLAIVRQVVEMHGGTVWAESEGENRGATFTVELPLSPQAPSNESGPNRDSVTTEAPLSNLQILLVDDETDTREFQAFLLEQSGASVTAVASGFEALQALDRFTPDVLVSDVGMSEMDGYMLMQQIRSRPPDKGGMIPAIALTAYARDFDQQQALQAGFQRHITKPIEPDKLILEVAMLIQRSTND
ncbi:hypothetical protein BWI75_18565 [Gloeocapsopsis sp. AAB1 = 1H9]|uniref:Circadian input-output histidine kinase CikA n=2 Tax=Gloeocapsopsis TaxID=693222 RepID=A0A6N8FYQ5_9CHRO|nr:hypothetical protein [Gloeocapsopsis dulcis AAB1 = 1H9]